MQVKCEVKSQDWPEQLSRLDLSMHPAWRLPWIEMCINYHSVLRAEARSMDDVIHVKVQVIEDDGALLAAANGLCFIAINFFFIDVFFVVAIFFVLTVNLLGHLQCLLLLCFLCNRHLRPHCRYVLLGHRLVHHHRCRRGQGCSGTCPATS
ncbi:hypothetical protein BRADI_4g25138v3 [Brachypodium distachyon]|uniref:Uncharacterized protein n=1 Tax=Brachypodium distachyon TaxID=15368 RepID=A0A0Q3IT90_BRADI|nr:hypothetical protein BRADI_4g25138v3 [Brachypodium distachyon]